MNTAHIHLMINHLPVVGFLLFVPLLFWSWSHRSHDIRRLVFCSGILLGMLTLPAFLTGEGAEEAIEDQAGFSESRLEPHEEAADLALMAALGTAGLSLTFLGLSFWRQLPDRLTFGSLLVASLLTNTAMGWTAYLGGQIQHSEIHGPNPLSSAQETRSARHQSQDHDDD
jgi:hypothetical protein